MSISLISKERFDPSRLSNLAVWLDGAASSTITLSGTTTQVTKWNDKSGNSNNFSVQPVPPPVIPPMEVVTRTTPGSASYTTSPLYSSTVSATLSGAQGGTGGGGVSGGRGGLALYTFTNVPPNTTIQYTVSSAGVSGNTPGGGGSTSITIGSKTVTAGGGGSGIKLIQGNPALAPFGGTPTTDATAGFFYAPTPTTIVVSPPPAGFSYTAGGGSPATANGSIIISPASSNFTSVGSAPFTVPALITSATITLNGAGGGGGGGGAGSGGRVVYTGSMPQGIYTWYVGGTGSGYTGGTGYRSGSNGPFVNGATGPYGGAPNMPGDSGFVSGAITTQDAPGFANTIGAGPALSGGTITIDLPSISPIVDTTPSTTEKIWTSPTYQSIVTIVLVAAGGGGGSSGNPGSGGNRGGNGAKVTLILTGVPPGTEFKYIVGSGGGSSQDLTPQTPGVPKDNNLFIEDTPKGGTTEIIGGGATPETTISPGTPGEPGSGASKGNGAGGGGYSSVSYTDPYRGVVTLVAGGGGGGAGYPYFSAGLPVDGGNGGRGGQTGSPAVGGLGGTLSGPQNSTAGPGGSGLAGWNGEIAGTSWFPNLTSVRENNNGGTAGDPTTGNNSGGKGGNGSVTFSVLGDGDPASFLVTGTFSYNPRITSTYILTVTGGSGGGGKGGRGVYTTTLSNGTTYTCITGLKGTGGVAGGQSSVDNMVVGTKPYTLVAGGGGGGGVNGNGGGGSSALQFPSGDVLVAGGGGGASPGGAGGGDANGNNGGSANGGNGGGFTSSSLSPFSTTSVGGGASSSSPGSITITYPSTNITTTVPGSFTTQVAGDYTITVNGAGGGGKPGGQGVYIPHGVASGTTFAYQVGQGGSGANSGAGTFLSPFVLADGPAYLKAGGGGGVNDTQDVGVAGESAYGGVGGVPGVNGGKGGPGTGGGNPSGVISIPGGGSAGNGSVYFTVTYISPTVSPSLTTYTNPGVLFPSGYMAVSSNLPGLGSAKTLMAVYQCSGAGASMNIGLGTNVSGSSFGLCQTDGKLYSPYQYGNGYDLTFTPANYTARSYAFASYGKAPYTITGLSGFDDTGVQVSAFENLTVDSSLILGRQLAGYPSGDFILYELIATSNALSASDRQEVEAYLALKWGLTLPAGHPYKNFQPSGDQWILTTLPTTVSGLALWLDTADSGTITLNGTGRVTSWSDKSGNGCNATAGGSSLPSFSPMGGILFNGTNNYFQTNLRVNSTTHTLIAIHKPNSVAKNTALFRFQASSVLSNYFVFPFQSSQPRGYINSGGSGILFNNSPLVDNSVPGVPNLIIADISPVGQQVYLNGTIQSSASSPIVSFTSDQLSIGSFYSGSTEFYEGTLYELIVYNQYFEQAERQLLEGYLAWKWDIVNKLPSSHPYAKESPIGATVSETLALNIPGQIPSLVTWLDAADPGTFVVSSGPNVSWYDKSATLDVFINGIYTVPTYTNTPGGTGSSLPGVYFSGLSSLVGKATANIASGTGSCFLVATVVGSVQVLMGGYQNGNPENGNSFGFYSQGGKVYCPIQGAQNQYINSLGNLQPESLTVFFAQMDSGTKTGQGSFQFSTPVNQGTGGIYWQASVPFPSPWNLGTTVASGGNPALGQAFYLHEFLCFSEYFNDNQRQLIEGYLAWKWGVQSQLPRTHPYSGGRPQSA